MSRIDKNGLAVEAVLHEFLVKEALPGLQIDADKFFADFSAIVHDLAPRNRELLTKRDALQLRIDDWYRQHGAPTDREAYQAFLRDIGYILPEGSDFQVSTANVDPEIASIAGPQLVVPVMNARYALNAANARWGSLYDALYGTDAIPESDGAEKGKSYNPKRGEKVIGWVRNFLDTAAPLDSWNWKDVATFAVRDGALAITSTDGEHVSLTDAAHFAGYLGDAAAPTQILLKNNGIHIDIVIDASTAIGKSDPAHISDVWLESAITTIMD
ncbi:MAG: malate synthase G, partial [Rhizobium altiplani]